MFVKIIFPLESRCNKCGKFAGFCLVVKDRANDMCGDCALELAKEIIETVEKEAE